MKCENYKTMITDLLAGELPEKEKSALESHLASCENCRKEMEEQSECWELIGSALKSEKIDDSLGKERHGRINKAASGKNTVPFTDLVRKFVWLELAAGLVLCAAITMILLPKIKDFSGPMKDENETRPTPPPAASEPKALKAEDAELKEIVPVIAKDKKDTVVHSKIAMKGRSGVSDNLDALADKSSYAIQTTLPIPENEPMKPATAVTQAAPAPAGAEQIAVMPAEATAPPMKASRVSTGAVAAKGSAPKAMEEAKTPLMKKKAEATPALDMDSSVEREKSQTAANDFAKGKGAKQAPAIEIQKSEPATTLRSDTQAKTNEEQFANRQVIQGFSGQNMMVETLTRTYQLDLKSIGVTDEKSFREYLKKNGAKFADSAKITLDLEKKTVTITAPSNTIADADKLLVQIAKAKIHPSSAVPAAEIESKADASKMSK